jgi:hypothetical protein
MSNGPKRITDLPVATTTNLTQDLLVIVQNTAGTNTTYSINPSVLLAGFANTTSPVFSTSISVGNSTANAQLGNITTSGNPSVLLGYGSSNSSIDLVITNANNGTNASSDFTAYDTYGLTSNNFVDMGILGVSYNQSTWTISGPSDGYLYTGNTNLSIGTASLGGGTNYINFFTGGTLAANERVRITSTGKVGIGTTAPGTGTILDVQSTAAGVRFPNMTTTQKNAITTPAAGTVVFDTTLSKLCVYTGAAWQTITSA